MKRIITGIASIAIAAASLSILPSFANNWQWQLDQIAIEQQCCTRCAGVERAKDAGGKKEQVKNKFAPSDANATVPHAKNSAKIA